MKLVPFGLAAVVCCLLACASACTAVLLALEHTASRDGAPWVDTSIVGTGVASAACALAAICFQIHRSRTPSSPKAGVLLAAAGAAAHTAMLATLSVYWSCFTFKTYYRSGSSNIGGGDPRRHIVQRQINYFEYYGRWSDEEAALYTLGCVGGVTAWLLAFVSAALDARTASKQHAGSSMPVAKCAPHAATFVVPLVPVPRELATPHHPCSRTNSGEELLSKTAALLQAEDDLQLLPGTPVQEDARAKC
ncbi:hypothetical protein D9Q98_000365 [Chlorella vulgaris]|uniref:Membrane-associated protein n=1 Tax=Chlorella vulgaris TaxID=3077 RepID=A0A9D4Z1K1_CHLVU|nr:hypothetical protein D9Q98_000365 [Chlorella vulgaris]